MVGPLPYICFNPYNLNFKIFFKWIFGHFLKKVWSWAQKCGLLKVKENQVLSQFPEWEEVLYEQQHFHPVRR